MNEDEPVRTDDVIDDVLGENPRASQLRLMRGALEGRRAALRAELERTTEEPDRTRLQNKIKTLDRQIEALRQEEAISEFVETSVKVTLTRSALDDEE
jgi:hypothetical protein